MGFVFRATIRRADENPAEVIRFNLQPRWFGIPVKLREQSRQSKCNINHYQVLYVCQHMTSKTYFIETSATAAANLVRSAASARTVFLVKNSHRPHPSFSFSPYNSLRRITTLAPFRRTSIMSIIQIIHRRSSIDDHTTITEIDICLEV